MKKKIVSALLTATMVCGMCVGASKYKGQFISTFIKSI